MSSVVNKNAAITAQNESNSFTKSSLRKWAERSLMLMAVLGTVIVCMLYGDLITRYINPPISKSIIYGRWVEQDVA
ncbi:N-acetylglutamate synthase, partial [Vibrio parahaemolyticus]|nr:N-acetylglutamate synthase [Vibrio parahaemolyticus]